MQGIKNLTQGPINRQLFNLAMPIMATSFIQMAYSLTDMAWVGRLGSEAVAAIVDLACLVIPGCADIEQLVVVVGSQILDAAEHRRAVLREVAADVERRAGKSRRHYGQRHGSRHDRRSDFLKRHHVPIPLSFIVGV